MISTNTVSTKELLQYYLAPEYKALFLNILNTLPQNTDEILYLSCMTLPNVFKRLVFEGSLRIPLILKRNGQQWLSHLTNHYSCNEGEIIYQLLELHPAKGKITEFPIHHHGLLLFDILGNFHPWRLIEGKTERIETFLSTIIMSQYMAIQPTAITNEIYNQSSPGFKLIMLQLDHEVACKLLDMLPLNSTRVDRFNVLIEEILYHRYKKLTVEYNF